MPRGNELGEFVGSFTSVRTCEVNGDNAIVEGSYSAKISGSLSGTAFGTLTLSGSSERGTLADLGTGYLDSGDVENYIGQGVYWAGSGGSWETRAAVMMGEQMLVAESRIVLTNGAFSLAGKVFELT